ncbi:MAG TPA: MBL fold metallo-hydrolase, partial [Sphingomicrobium sp.]|nr:MBL fold metallo-hydrolase [Sphingomicrobium sp.]
MAAGPRISAFFDECTNSVSYLVADPATGQAAVIDPVLDFDPASGEMATRSAERILAAADGLSIGLVLETHPHADHLTAAPFFKERTGARV